MFGSIVVSGVLMFLKIRIRIMNHQLQFDVSETLYRIPYAFSHERIISTDLFILFLHSISTMLTVSSNISN